MTAYWLLLAFTLLERLVEMLVSRSNAAWSFARGGREAGASHFPVMIALHAAFLVGCVVEPLLRGTGSISTFGKMAFVLALLCQVLRWWCIRTLGRQWNTRVIVVPGAARVAGGPYRWLRHPNYLAVVVEGLALPAVAGAWVTAMLFTVANALLLRRRLATENLALDALRASVEERSEGGRWREAGTTA